MMKYMSWKDPDFPKNAGILVIMSIYLKIIIKIRDAIYTRTWLYSAYDICRVLCDDDQHGTCNCRITQ
jgi:hypothetical protein